MICQTCGRLNQTLKLNGGKGCVTLCKMCIKDAMRMVEMIEQMEAEK